MVPQDFSEDVLPEASDQGMVLLEVPLADFEDVEKRVRFSEEDADEGTV